jgi:hypothetical protein
MACLPYLNVHGTKTALKKSFQTVMLVLVYFLQVWLVLWLHQQKMFIIVYTASSGPYVWLYFFWHFIKLGTQFLPIVPSFVY